MRAVWSFWSKPFHGYMGRTWLNPLHIVSPGAFRSARAPALPRDHAGHRPRRSCVSR